MMPFTLIGIALEISLGFRNNASYDRFWEGRKLWGEWVNASCNLTRYTYFVLDSSESCEKLQYCNEDPKEEISRLLPSEDCINVLKSTHRSLAILQQLDRSLALAREDHWLHEFNFPFINNQVNELPNILGVCERIQSTPIPLSYSNEIEDPFGLEPNDLPLKAISRNIEINLLELIDELDRLEPLKPRKGILM